MKLSENTTAPSPAHSLRRFLSFPPGLMLPVWAFLLISQLFVSCEPVDHLDSSSGISIDNEDIAVLLSELSLSADQYSEVYDAVSSSADNGYDEEYTMRDLFESPGAGVGDSLTKALGLSTKSSGKTYEKPLRDLISEYLTTTKSSSSGIDALDSGEISSADYLAALMSSDVQIYWPYYENWDSETSPIITFDPGDGSDANIGYKIVWSDSGSKFVERVMVTEEMAMQTPVWVVNRNDDSEYISLEMLRRQDPDWGAGGSIIVGKSSSETKAAGTKAEEDETQVLRTLILKEFKATRNFDTWFAGASEFFVKTGAVEDFSASTEAELQLYDPSITDFMITVRRRQVGETIPFNAVLVSQWSDQLTSCAFMITEDDGGTQTSWKCSAEVKIKSKTTGFSIEIPYHSRDDIVWRGQLSRLYLEKYSGKEGHFGDIDITFELIEE